MKLHKLQCSPKKFKYNTNYKDYIDSDFENNEKDEFNEYSTNLNTI